MAAEAGLRDLVRGIRCCRALGRQILTVSEDKGRRLGPLQTTPRTAELQLGPSSNQTKKPGRWRGHSQTNVLAYLFASVAVDVELELGGSRGGLYALLPMVCGAFGHGWQSSTHDRPGRDDFFQTDLKSAI